VTDNFLQIVHLPGQKDSSVIHGKLSGAVIDRVKFMVKFFLPNCILTEFYIVFFSTW